MAHEIVSIEEIVRRKSYKNSIDKMNVDIKALINPDMPRYTNLLHAPNSQRLVGRVDLTKQLKPLPKTVYLREEISRVMRTQHPTYQRSRENLVRTEVRPTPENSFRESKEPAGKLAPMPRKSSQRQEVDSKEAAAPSKQMKMNKTLNAFLFKMQLPDNQRVSSCQTKKRIRFIKESQSNSIDLRVEINPSREKQTPKASERIQRLETVEQLERGEVEQDQSPDRPDTQTLQCRERPPRPRRQQKIPEFIKINLEIEEQRQQSPPKAAVMFAERRVKSVIKLRKRKDDRSGSKQPQKERPDRQNKLKDAILQEYKRFATIQPQVTELKILSKLQRKFQRKLYKCESGAKDLRQESYTRESRRKKRKIITDKLYQHQHQGQICGWNNQQNDDHVNLF